MTRSKLKTLWVLFIIFFKAGTVTFAGGLAMLPMIQKDVVKKHKLMPMEDFLEYATLSQTLPGMVAVNCASFVGRRTAGFPGMLTASFGASLSAFVLMILATVLIQLVPQEGVLLGAFGGIRAASAALILSAAFTLGRYNIKSLFSLIIMLAVFILVLFLKVNILVIILAAGAAGVLFQWLKVRKVKV